MHRSHRNKHSVANEVICVLEKAIAAALGDKHKTHYDLLNKLTSFLRLVVSKLYFLGILMRYIYLYFLGPSNHFVLFAPYDIYDIKNNALVTVNDVFFGHV